MKQLMKNVDIESNVYLFKSFRESRLKTQGRLCKVVLRLCLLCQLVECETQNLIHGHPNNTVSKRRP